MVLVIHREPEKPVLWAEANKSAAGRNHGVPFFSTILLVDCIVNGFLWNENDFIYLYRPVCGEIVLFVG